MLETLKSPKTGKYHSGAPITIMCGVLGLAVIIGVILGKIGPEWLASIIVPIIGWGSMAFKNKKENGQ